MIVPIQNNPFNDFKDSMDSAEVAPIKYIYVVRQEAAENAHGGYNADDTGIGDDLIVGSHYPSPILDDTDDYDGADDAVEDDDGYFVGYDDEDHHGCCLPPAEESKDLRWSSEQVHIGRPRSQSFSPSMPARESPDVASLRRWCSMSKSESATDFAPIMPSRTRPRSRSESSLGHADLIAEKAAILLPSPSAACHA